jgi:hypothetical protein
MAGTFDPNQAQNLAEVRHPVPRSLRWRLRVPFVVGGFRSRNSAYPRLFLIPPLFLSLEYRILYGIFTCLTLLYYFYRRFAVKAVEHAQVSA